MRLFAIRVHRKEEGYELVPLYKAARGRVVAAPSLKAVAKGCKEAAEDLTARLVARGDLAR